MPPSVLYEKLILMADFFEKLTRSIKATEGSSPAKPPRKVNFVAEGYEEPTPKSSAPDEELLAQTRPSKIGGKETPLEEKPQEEGQLTIDVYQTENDIVIRSTIAGVKPEDIDIDITPDMVTIKGKRVNEEVVSDENYFYQECYWGAFSRSIILPQDISPDKAEATMKNGVLTVRLPKIESLRTKKLKVKPTT